MLGSNSRAHGFSADGYYPRVLLYLDAWEKRLEFREHRNAGAALLLAGPTWHGHAEPSVHHRPQCESRLLVRSLVPIRSNGRMSNVRSRVLSVLDMSLVLGLLETRWVVGSKYWCTILL